MKRRNILKTALVAVFALSLFAGSAMAAMAPMNPAFTGEKAETVQIRTSSGTSFTGGRTPSPVDMSHLAGVDVFAGEAQAKSKSGFAVAYDLRTNGYVTPVKNQDPYGACWTFSPMASLESTYLKAGGSGIPDYAEQFTGYYGFIDQSATLLGFGNYSSSTSSVAKVMDLGGDDFKATALLSRWTGIVNEVNAPYGSTAPSASAPVARHLTDVHYFYYDAATRYQPTSIENIKQALISYGAVSIGMYAGDPLGGNWSDSPYFNSTTSASYIPSGNSAGLSVGSANHAVTVVGWNNEYSKDNFNPSNQPLADGAWIVKNSWGSTWGDGGYFYLSYEDAAMDTGAAYVAGPADNYDSIYQYDIFGWCNSYAPSGMSDNTAWFANVFTAASDEDLEAVSFYAGGVGNTYVIKVYTEVTDQPVSGNQRVLKSGTISTPGYHTIKLDSPQALSANQKFSVVVKLKTPGYAYPVAIEYPISGYSDKAVASAGQSFVSANGTTWTDAVTLDANTNVCLKAFTSGGTTPTPDPATGGGGGGCSVGFAPALILLALPLVFLKK